MNPAFLLNANLRRQFEAAQARRAAPADADLAAHQLTAIAATWSDATRDVPYYARLVADCLAPATIRTWDDVRAIPVLTRSTFQQHSSEFIRRSGPPQSVMKTAGSTGTPLRMGMNQAERDVMRVVKLSEWQSFGYDQSSRLFLIWGHSHRLGTRWTAQVNHLKRRLADAALGYRRVDAHHLTMDACVAHAEELVAFKPIGVIGYASALDLFARYTSSYRDRFRRLGVRFVLATSEVPPRRDTLDLLEDHFACPVVQEYGGAEFGQVAFKAGRDPFVTYGDLNFVEVQPPDGSEYPVVITSLYRRYVPLVRYQVGDAVSGADVSAHGHVTRFDAVAGRLNDVIALGPGDVIHSVSVFHCVHQENVLNIQMALLDDGIELRLVSPETNRAAMESRIRARLAQVHPVLAAARFTYLEDLETTLAGKRRWFVDHRSRIPGAEEMRMNGC